jgi:2-methylcitrate dehydratase PrpD
MNRMGRPECRRAWPQPTSAWTFAAVLMAMLSAAAVGAARYRLVDTLAAALADFLPAERDAVREGSFAFTKFGLKTRDRMRA